MAPPAAMLLQDEMYYGRGGGSMAPVEITGSEPHVVGGHGLSGFWIDRHEVTNAQFARYVAATVFAVLAGWVALRGFG